MLDDLTRQFAVDYAEEIADERQREVDENLEAHGKATEAELWEDFAPGGLGFHELLDRSFIALDFWHDYIRSHPACITDPALFEKAHLIGELLYSFYNDVGGKWAEIPKDLPELTEADKAALDSLPSDLVERLFEQMKQKALISALKGGDPFFDPSLIAAQDEVAKLEEET